MRQEEGGSAIEAGKIAGHSSVDMTADYTVVQLIKQEELTRAIQRRRSRAKAVVKCDQATAAWTSARGPQVVCFAGLRNGTLRKQNASPSGTGPDVTYSLLVQHLDHLKGLTLCRDYSRRDCKRFSICTDDVVLHLNLFAVHTRNEISLIFADSLHFHRPAGWEVAFQKSDRAAVDRHRIPS
jgi:hypothetical protein